MCFTGKYPVRQVHTKLHPGPEWRISISSQMRKLMRLFLGYLRLFMQICRYTKKLHGCSKIWIIFSHVETLVFILIVMFSSYSTLQNISSLYFISYFSSKYVMLHIWKADSKWNSLYLQLEKKTQWVGLIF